MSIQAVRTRYRDTWFASTLEADWAATFDTLEWHWEYEPLAVKLPSGKAYRPDFRLPSQRTWAEVKGPHNERLNKTKELVAAVAYDEWEWASDIVVVLRPPGPGETAWWEGARGDEDIVIVRCPDCEHYGFMDYSGWWTCRRHITVPPRKFWADQGGGLYRPGELAFTRAPRPQRRAA